MQRGIWNASGYAVPGRGEMGWQSLAAGSVRTISREASEIPRRE